MSCTTDHNPNLKHRLQTLSPTDENLLNQLIDF